MEWDGGMEGTCKNGMTHKTEGEGRAHSRQGEGEGTREKERKGSVKGAFYASLVR